LRDAVAGFQRLNAITDAFVKILHVIHSVNPANGGPIEGIKQLAVATTRLGFEIEVVCLDRPDAPWLKEFPLTVHALGPSYLSYGYCPRLIPWLKAHCRDFDFVVVNGIWQFTSFAARHVLRKRGIPYFVFTHGMLDPWFKEHYPLKHIKKWLYWPWAEYRVLRDATAVLFTCLEEKILARNTFWLYQCHEAVVSYGTGGWQGDAVAQKQLFLEKFPQLQNKRQILFLGRMHEKKGGDLLVDAFHRLLLEKPDARLHLVMVGPDDNAFARKLKKMIESKGIGDHVTWTGMLTGDEKWGAFQAAEVFILPSHQENFGISVAEALSASLPVLISNKVNIWREIEQANAGLVATDDEEGTYSLLTRWMDLGAQEREEAGIRARACFMENFEIMGAAKSLLKVYGDFLQYKAGINFKWKETLHKTTRLG